MVAKIRPPHPERLSPCARSAAENDARRHDLRRGRDGGLRIELARPGASRREMKGFLPSPFGRRAGDEGLRERQSVFLLVRRGREVAFKDTISIGIDAAGNTTPRSSPHLWGGSTHRLSYL